MSINSQTSSLAIHELANTLGASRHPIVIDVRRQPAFDASERLICASRRVAPDNIVEWQKQIPPHSKIVAVCVHGHEVSQNAAAALCELGHDASYLTGGIEAWLEAQLPSIRKSNICDGSATTRWITRERPKIDRIACPWLVQRFIDPNAEFLYAPTAEVFDRASELGAISSDIPGAEFSHRGDACSFDTFLEVFDLRDAALSSLAKIIRGADTSRLDLTLQSGGLYAISLGLSGLIADDHQLLSSGMLLYDALYRWQRDLQGESHNWPPQMPQRMVRQRQ